MSIKLNAALLCMAFLCVGFSISENASAVEKSKSRVVAQKAKATKSPVLKKAGSVAKKQKAKAHPPAKVVSGGKASVSGTILWQETGKLAVQSGSALVVDQGGGEPLFQKNASAVAPIASITKLMTAMVVLDGSPSLQAPIAISDDDVDYLRGSRSRLSVGAVMSRETALLLALMSSENRAANALARHYPGGMPAFLSAMNVKAQSLGMRDTRFEDPTGLSSNNVSTAHDLAKMVAAAYRYPLIREFSTTSESTVDVGGRELAFRNTNPLVKNSAWDVGLSKTGYIHEAGKCLVMQARVAEKPVVIVLLDSAGKLTRVGDANRIKRWMENTHAAQKVTTHAGVDLKPDGRPG